MEKPAPTPGVRVSPVLKWLIGASIAFAVLLAVAALFGGRKLVRDWRRAEVLFSASRPAPQLPTPNAFPEYVAAANAIKDTSYNKALSSDTPRKNAEAKRRFTLEEKQALLKKNGEALRRLRRAFAHEYREPPIPPSFDVPLPYYARFRELARLLAFESEVKAAQGDAFGAVNSGIDAIRLGTDIPRGSAMIGRLVGIACESVGRKRLWPVLHRLDAEQARAASRRMLTLAERRTPLWKSFEEEKTWNQEILRDWHRNPETFNPSDFGTEGGEASGEEGASSASPAGPWLSWMLRQAMVNYSDYMDRSIALLRQPYPEQGPPPEVPGDVLTSVLAPATIPASSRDTNSRTQNLLLVIAFALQSYKSEYGTYPKDLSALIPEHLPVLPEDPFATEGTFKYRRSGNAYRLYSVGPDGEDNGGKPIDDPAQVRSSENKNPRARYFVREDSKGDIVAGINL